MMTMDAENMLAESLQMLIDARLDTIDRMLLGRVNRHDRLAIVREVESQIFEQLRGRDAGTLDRDDVLAVLARLDPPEAYLGDELPAPGPRPAYRPSASGSSPRVDPTGTKLALTSGIIGIVSIPALFLGVLIAITLQSFVIFFGSIALGLIGGLLAIIFAARARLQNAWAVVGLVTGVVSMMASPASLLFG